MPALVERHQVDDRLVRRVRAEIVGGTVLGNANYEISDLSDLQSAGPSELSFLATSKYLPQFYATRAGGVLVSDAIAEPHTNLIVCPNPYLALAPKVVDLDKRFAR